MPEVALSLIPNTLGLYGIVDSLPLGYECLVCAGIFCKRGTLGFNHNTVLFVGPDVHDFDDDVEFADTLMGNIEQPSLEMRGGVRVCVSLVSVCKVLLRPAHRADCCRGNGTRGYALTSVSLTLTLDSSTFCSRFSRS